jgi:hypothetical protein
MSTGSIIAQAGIMAFGVSAIWLVGQTNPKVRRWGFVCGICSQPFWLYTTISHEQWGIAAMSLLYAASWANGLRKNWRIADDAL